MGPQSKKCIYDLNTKGLPTVLFVNTFLYESKSCSFKLKSILKIAFYSYVYIQETIVVLLVLHVPLMPQKYEVKGQRQTYTMCSIINTDRDEDFSKRYKNFNYDHKS